MSILSRKGHRKCVQLYVFFGRKTNASETIMAKTRKKTTATTTTKTGRQKKGDMKHMEHRKILYTLFATITQEIFRIGLARLLALSFFILETFV